MTVKTLWVGSVILCVLALYLLASENPSQRNACLAAPLAWFGIPKHEIDPKSRREGTQLLVLLLFAFGFNLIASTVRAAWTLAKFW